MLAADKDKNSKLLAKIRADNAVSDRAIKQNKLAQNKKDEHHKNLREIRQELRKELEDTNAKIFTKSWKLNRETARFNDKDLMRRMNRETISLRQANSLCTIDINIAESRMKDLESQREMCETQLKEILTDKRAIDKENAELEYQNSGRGMTEADQKAKYAEAELKMKKELEHSLQVMREDAEVMDEQLKEEEKKCKDMLDRKITAEQTFRDFTEPDAEAMADRKQKNREDLIKCQIKLSQLKSQKARTTTELEALEASNAEVIKANEDYTTKNDALNKEILELIQRIDVSTLLKEVDLEEMKLLATNNINMNAAFTAMLNRWDDIRLGKKEDPNVN